MKNYDDNLTEPPLLVLSGAEVQDRSAAQLFFGTSIDDRDCLGMIYNDVEAPNLLVKIAQEDRTALSQLYDRYSRMIYAIAWKSLNSVEDCEAVVLDIFAQVWRIANRFDIEKGSIEQWLFTLARSRILDQLRKLQRLNKVTEAILLHRGSANDTGKEIEFPTVSVDPIQAVEIVERRQQVLAALCTIPLAQREVIELAYYQGLTHTEIAKRTGLSLGTVKTRLRLGLNKLKVAFDRE